MEETKKKERRAFTKKQEEILNEMFKTNFSNYYTAVEEVFNEKQEWMTELFFDVQFCLNVLLQDEALAKFYEKCKKDYYEQIQENNSLESKGE